MAFKLSTKSRYGTRAIIEIAKSYGKAPIKRKDIVKSQGLSGPYLENILIALKNNGILVTIRGAQGGYTLQRPPREINLYEVVRVLEGSLVPVECLKSAAVCKKTATCAARSAWKELMNAQEKVLRSITLQNLLDRGETEALDFCI
jgi:Rrf2 family transcriptional regulator, cysteine metabolism repressor